MRVGIFARTFPGPSVVEILDQVAAHGIPDVQFNMSCAGRPTLPEEVEPELCSRVAQAFARRGLRMAAVSGTFNMAHPDPEVRRAGVRGLGVLARSCKTLGTSVITLCTGTRDPDDMWRWHADNHTPAAWGDLVETVRTALNRTEGSGVTLAFEPEVSNVVDSAAKARCLLDEVASPRLKVVIDPANLFHAGELSRMRKVLDEAFEHVGPDIVLAHAKDLSRDGEAGNQAAGTGRLDYDRYVTLLRESGYDGPLILHGLREDQVAASATFLRGKIGNRDGG
jgi:sugar phosphate isomerase/epimerase